MKRARAAAEGHRSGRGNAHHARWKKPDLPPRAPMHTCIVCIKPTFRDKRTAKAAGNQKYPNVRTWPVYCEHANGWHYTAVKAAPDGTPEENP